jgi:hypothetical protein
MSMHNQSEGISKIAPALVKALAQITDVGKDRTATIKSDKGNFTYKYATLVEVMGIIRPIFAANGLTMMQFTRGHEDGKRIEVETMALHESGEWISDTLTLPLEGGGARGAGSAITYARRYGAQAFVGMASDDDDAAAAERAEHGQENAKWEKQLADYLAAIDGSDNEDEAKGHYHKAVALCKAHDDVGAANRLKAKLTEKFPTLKAKQAA